ncbi:MAG: helix-turn-helix transcriptional regulator [Pseudomonadota bacterium]
MRKGDLYLASAFLVSAIDAMVESLSEEPRLTNREREVLQWAAAGKTHFETGVILGLSERTIKHHLMCAREKLDAANTVHAVSRALARRLIHPG